jgi:hypothetical protein
VASAVDEFHSDSLSHDGENPARDRENETPPRKRFKSEREEPQSPH